LSEEGIGDWSMTLLDAIADLIYPPDPGDDPLQPGPALKWAILAALILAAVVAWCLRN